MSKVQFSGLFFLALNNMLNNVLAAIALIYKLLEVKLELALCFSIHFYFLTMCIVSINF